ncbi:MAG: hypothetical protein HeimC3_32140 [Candidatus Heimdallarchaeota archaeon LC_3]|nr:MAG: hypothetical protein HeimC3_32140 [Candidatus Heimdallarchaeota archaeon LC_3]
MNLLRIVFHYFFLFLESFLNHRKFQDHLQLHHFSGSIVRIGTPIRGFKESRTDTKV